MSGAVASRLRAAISRVRDRAPAMPDPAGLLGALPVPMVVLDAENRFRYANHAAEQFLGVSTAH
ncbi:MAG TPA: PAS domain-containing protein, partial [Acetobacteraceae bacterium]|nr:PAS domain-containing protein [Acetobacteraceae bacterium]